MELKVAAADRETWLDLSRRDSACTFFQTPAWHEAAAPAMHGVPAPLLFDFGSARAVLPLVRVKRPFREAYLSPFGTYTGLICPDKLKDDQLRAAQARLSAFNLELFTSPFARNPLAVGRATPNATYVIDLGGVDPDDVPASWSNNQRRHRRAAQKAGLATGLAAGVEDVKAYYAVYEKTLERWGGKARSRYPLEFFQGLWETLAPGGGMRLWLARHEGKIIGGDIVFYHNRHSVQWHGVVDAAYFKSGATQALLDAIIADAARRGLELYDMNPSGGMAAVENFKKDFGSRRLEFRTYMNQTFPWSWLSGARRRLGRLRAGRP